MKVSFQPHLNPTGNLASKKSPKSSSKNSFINITISSKFGTYLPVLLGCWYYSNFRLTSCQKVFLEILQHSKYLLIFLLFPKKKNQNNWFRVFSIFLKTTSEIYMKFDKNTQMFHINKPKLCSSKKKFFANANCGFLKTGLILNNLNLYKSKEPFYFQDFNAPTSFIRDLFSERT